MPNYLPPSPGAGNGPRVRSNPNITRKFFTYRHGSHTWDIDIKMNQMQLCCSIDLKLVPPPASFTDLQKALEDDGVHRKLVEEFAKSFNVTKVATIGYEGDFQNCNMRTGDALSKPEVIRSLTPDVMTLTFWIPRFAKAAPEEAVSTSLLQMGATEVDTRKPIIEIGGATPGGRPQLGWDKGR
jgi:hypothetical protein